MLPQIRTSCCKTLIVKLENGREIKVAPIKFFDKLYLGKGEVNPWCKKFCSEDGVDFYMDSHIYNYFFEISNTPQGKEEVIELPFSQQECREFFNVLYSENIDDSTEFFLVADFLMLKPEFYHPFIIGLTLRFWGDYCDERGVKLEELYFINENNANRIVLAGELNTYLGELSFLNGKLFTKVLAKLYRKEIFVPGSVKRFLLENMEHFPRYHNELKKRIQAN